MRVIKPTINMIEQTIHQILYFISIMFIAKLFDNRIECDNCRIALQVTIVHVLSITLYYILISVIYQLVKIKEIERLNILYNIISFMLPFIIEILSLVIAENTISEFEVNGVSTYAAMLLLSNIC